MWQQKKFIVRPGGKLSGTIRVPGDKSISHRAIMMGALAEGDTEIEGFLGGMDCLSTLEAFREMGVSIEERNSGHVYVKGIGLHGLRKPSRPLDLGNSGTAMRLLAGLLAGQSFDTELIGDISLSRRPMGRIIEPLRRMGAHIKATLDGTPPLMIYGGRHLIGIKYNMPVASAQVKSALLLAGLYAEGKTCITEPTPTRDHTERMLTGFGYPLERSNGSVCVESGITLAGQKLRIPADISSAAFYMVGASIAPGSDILLECTGLNPTRIGVINILKRMGANIEVFNVRDVSGEPVGDVRVRSAALQGIDIPEFLIPLAIDEFPVLFVAAACAEGETRLRGARELRVKESDRIEVMAEGLRQLGVTVETLPDGINIRGKEELAGGCVDSTGDHRVAMAFSMAGLRARNPIVVENCDNVETSFPGFVKITIHAGLDMNVTCG